MLCCFRVLPNFRECFYNSIGTRRTRFLFLLENTATKKKKNNLFTRSSKCKFSLFAPSLRQQLVLVSIELRKHGFKPISVRINFGLFSNFNSIRLRARVFYEQIVNEAQPS